MKKKFLQVVLILFILTLYFMFSACNESLLAFKEYESLSIIPRAFSVYVCGAVEREGFVNVEEGASLDSVVYLAGIIPQTVIPDNLQKMVTENDKVVSLQYFDGQKLRYCVNLNGVVIQNRLAVAGIDADIINKIADYYVLHGKITDRNLLKSILGPDYQENYYKFFVDVTDYEKVS